MPYSPVGAYIQSLDVGEIELAGHPEGEKKMAAICRGDKLVGSGRQFE